MIIFSLPFTPAAVPWNDEFDWNAVNYAPMMVGGLFLVVGIWWLLGAKDSYHGPVRTIQFDEAAGVIEDEPEAPPRRADAGLAVSVPGPPQRGPGDILSSCPPHRSSASAPRSSARAGASGTSRPCCSRAATSTPCSARAASR